MNAPIRSVSLSVPGNLLLMGEYAVLEEGGLGLALAVEPRVLLQASSARRLHVDGVRPGGSGRSAVVEAAVAVTEEFLGRTCAGSLRVDSRAFFSADGRKIGLGSSAAVTVSLVCALLSLAGRSDAARGAEAAALAVRAHRRAQQGRGSGYDVLASFHGGAGAVRGGVSPTWEPCALPAGVELVLFAGAAPVSTADAVRRYSEWKNGNPAAAARFLRDSNETVLSFRRSPTVEQLCRSLAACRRLGIDMGKAIGVPAHLVVPEGLDGSWCKALGAGNEIGLCLVPPGAARPARVPGGRTVLAAERGVAWEE